MESDKCKYRWIPSSRTVVSAIFLSSTFNARDKCGFAVKAEYQSLLVIY